MASTRLFRSRNTSATLLHDDVPNECILIILTFLDRQTLCSLRATNSVWFPSVLSVDDSLWRPFFDNLLKLNHSNLLKHLRRLLPDRVLQRSRISEESLGFLLSQLPGPPLENQKARVRTVLRILSQSYRDWDPVEPIYAQRCFVGDGEIDISALARVRKDRLGNLEEPWRNTMFTLVGDHSAGKSSLLIQTVRNRWHDRYVPSVFDNMIIRVPFDRYGQFELNVWDTTDYGDYEILRVGYQKYNYENDVFVFCYDISNRESFNNIKLNWIDDVRSWCPESLFILCACKIDLREEVEVEEREEIDLVTSDEAREFVREEDGFWFFVETSAKRGVVEELIPSILVCSMIKRYGVILKKPRKCNLM